MDEYAAPVRDMRFVLENLVDVSALQRLPGYDEVGVDLILTVLDEAGKLARQALSPLNRKGDHQPAVWSEGYVTTTPGWKKAYTSFIEGGWNGLSSSPEFGGQGLPRLVSAMTSEIWNGANVAFGLCPMLTLGAVDALEWCASDELKEAYLPKLISGEWTGTMNLTEPQAGSDLAAVRTRAIPQGDGSYRLHGQKIFITYGEHDLTDNIIHLVLGRTPDAPPGVKGISLFVAPKVVQRDGQPDQVNDLACGSIEHKLGIHGSPTCTMDFGSGEGALAYLVGEENRGLEYMFVMMNSARFNVGLQGLGLSQRALQMATEYAAERRQGLAVGDSGPERSPIDHHPDVQRMLALMSSQTEAMRAVAAVVAAAMDTAAKHPEAPTRKAQQLFVDLMIPVVKGWMTETSQDITSLAVQVHGGMGYVEETGVAQLMRDARITTIYEGTTGIQALDLVGRKIARDQGSAARLLLADIRGVIELLAGAGDALNDLHGRLERATDDLEQAVAFVVERHPVRPRDVQAGSVPLLRLFGIVAGGWQLARSALAAQKSLQAEVDPEFHRRKIGTARFYALHILAQSSGLLQAATAGSL
jgi:alkylation response protein AidB-like acyl-CoA dehydrogenase